MNECVRCACVRACFVCVCVLCVCACVRAAQHVGPLWASLTANSIVRPTTSKEDLRPKLTFGLAATGMAGISNSGSPAASDASRPSSVGANCDAASAGAAGARSTAADASETVPPSPARSRASTNMSSASATPIAHRGFLLAGFRRVVIAPGTCAFNYELAVGRVRFVCLHNVSNPTTCTAWAAAMLFTACMVLLVVENAGKFVLADELACYSDIVSTCQITISFMVYMLLLPALPITEPVLSFAALALRRARLLRLASVLTVVAIVNPVMAMLVYSTENNSAEPSFLWTVFYGVPTLDVVLRLVRVFLMQKFLASIESAPVTSWQSLLYISKDSKDFD